MSVRGNRSLFLTDRGKHEKIDNKKEKDDTDQFGIASLLFGTGDQSQKADLDDLANTPTKRFTFDYPPIRVHRSQSVYSDTLSSPYSRRKSNDEIKRALESISTQIKCTGQQILSNTRHDIADLRQDVRQMFRHYAIGSRRSVVSEKDEMNIETKSISEQLQKAKQRKNIEASFETGAVGGSLKYSLHCTENEIVDNVAEWKIDEEAWDMCIKQKDRQEVQRLISERILPNQEKLNKAYVEFGRNSRILKVICNEISSYIKAESKDIVSVWAGYKHTEENENTIIFAVITTTKQHIVNAFNYNVEQICIDEVNNSQENKDIQQRENEIPLREEDLNKAQTRMNRHSQGLMKRHSNISRITVSWVRSSRYGTEDETLTSEVCIAIYVPKKGLIPIDEKFFPNILNGFSVDVREGICVPFLGSHDFHECVKMGCAISGASVADQTNIGTLGGFFEHGNQIYCLTSAHVFSQNPHIKDLNCNGTWTAEDDNPCNYVYQPTPSSEPFGTLVRAVFSQGGGGTAGVDAAVIHVQKRFPNAGIFPDASNDREAGFDDVTPMTFNSGNISQKVNRMSLVVKHGSTTEITKGTFRARGGAVQTNTAHNWGIVLFNQYEIESFSDKPFAQPGDSGAMVFTVEGNELSGIGLVEAGMGNTCFVTPIYDVFSALEIPRPFKMKQFIMQDNSSTALTVDCPAATTETDNVITQSGHTDDLNERFDYMDQALSQEVARQVTEIKEELNIKVDQQLSSLKTEINAKIEHDITKLQTNINQSMTNLEGKMKDMQTENRNQMLQMEKSMERKMEAMLGKFLSQINQKK